MGENENSLKTSAWTETTEKLRYFNVQLLMQTSLTSILPTNKSQITKTKLELVVKNFGKKEN